MTEMRTVARCVLMLAGSLACAGALAQAVPSEQAASAADRAQKQADRTLYWIRVLAEKPVPKPAAKPAPAPVQAAAPVAAAAPRATAAAAESRPPAQKVASGLVSVPSELGGSSAGSTAPSPPMPGAGGNARAAGARGIDPGSASPAVAGGLAAPALTAPDIDVPQVEAQEPDPGLVMVKSADPEFPMSTMRRLRKGEVEVRFEVGADGQVDVVTVVRSTNPGLNNAALDAVRQWQFKPTPRGHTAVVDLAFNLDS
jgi:TonB family protein